jgi:demethoxyubiquinone hydroxylase (CLK1/Coq7/Cat5 family)
MEQITPQAFVVRENILNRPIEQLSSFCRGEMSAIETYERAIKVTREAWVLMQLRSNLASHDERVRVLKQRILDLGGDPPEGSGPWGAFASALEGVASAIGEQAALAILEEGERHGLADYRSDLENLDFDSQNLVETQIIPQQIRTHMSLHEIVQAITA